MYKFIKRLADIIFALLAILIFLPFFIPIALLLKLTGEGYIFYLQDRIGFNNTHFKIWKFATMLKASPALGTGSITVKNDWRLTPMGKFLRSTKLNEVPQIVNILKGDMSVVGPRPLMDVDFRKFSPELQAAFYNVRPGLTGIASIVFRDEEQYFSTEGIDPHEYDRLYIAPYKGALELWYQQHVSAWTDLKIIFLTAWVIILPKSRLIYRFFGNLPPKPQHL
jgi:lipopolysaccharide/colanic/teichoic acid biosynthesis glycosyltransferase